MEIIKYKDNLWTRIFLYLLIISFMSTLSQCLLMSGLPIYTISLGSTASFGGLLTAVFSISALITRFVSGTLSDKIGRRVIMVSGSAIFVVSTILHLVTHNLMFILFLRFFQGIGFSAVITASTAAVADVSPNDRLGEAIGFYGVGSTLASAFGPLVVLALASQGRFNALFVIATLCSAVSLLLSLPFRDSMFREVDFSGVNDKKSKEKMKSYFRDLIEIKAIPATIVHLILCFGMATVTSFFVLYASQMKLENAGFFFILSAAAMFVVRAFGGGIADNYHPNFLLVPGLITGAISLLLIPYSNNSVVFYIAGLLFGVFYGACRPTLNAIAIKDSPAHRRGVSSSTFLISMDIGMGVASFFWGIIIDAAGYQVMFISGAVCLVITGILSMILFRTKKG